MTEHGGNEEIVGGDATPRERMEKAAQEAFYDLASGGAIMAARARLMEAYDGAERARFEQAVAEAVGGLVDDLDGGDADPQSFVGDLMDEYDRRYGDDPFRSGLIRSEEFLKRYAAHHDPYGGSEEMGKLRAAAEVLNKHSAFRRRYG